MKSAQFLGLAAAVLFAGAVLASRPAAADEFDIRKADNGLSLGIGESNLDYRETGAGATPASSALDAENGWLPTANLSYGFLSGPRMLIPNLYLHLDLSGSLGNTRYTGATLYTDIPITATTKDQFYSGDAQIGIGIPVVRNTLVIPFIEGGYRYWNRNLGSATGIEDYQNGEFMGGILAQYSPFSRWVFALSGSAGTTIGAQMTSSGGGNPNQTFQLGSTMVWQAQGSIGYRLTNNIELTAAAQYLSFGYGQSPIAGNGFYEPTSTTQQTTLLLGVTWEFF